MWVLCVGVNHKTADVALREKLAFDAAKTRRALRELGDGWPAAEFVIVSTCNRSEIYAAPSSQGPPDVHELGNWLGKFHGLKADQFAEALYTLADTEAIGHLFAVSAGLDSLVPGEAQIITQLKNAYASAVEARTAGAVMNELFQKAFHVAKHVRRETGIGLGKVSVASVAVECVERVLKTVTGKCVLSVGAGKMNELMLKYLSKLGAAGILLANRSAERARQLAARCGAKAVAFEALPKHLAAADVVLSSTGAETPIITRRMIENAQKKRHWRPLLMIDLAVPRDVEPQAGELENVSLYNIDDLDRIVRRTLKIRHGRRTAAEEIIERHVRELSEALNIREAGATIEALYRRMEEIAAAEFAAARRKLSDHDKADHDAEILRRALWRTIRRIMHPAATGLRRTGGTNEARIFVDALRKLFELDKSSRDL